MAQKDETLTRCKLLRPLTSSAASESNRARPRISLLKPKAGLFSLTEARKGGGRSRSGKENDSSLGRKPINL